MSEESIQAGGRRLASSAYNYDDVVTVRVIHGLQTKDYKVFRELLRWHSAYFTAALDSNSGFKHDNGILDID